MQAGRRDNNRQERQNKARWSEGAKAEEGTGGWETWGEGAQPGTPPASTN